MKPLTKNLLLLLFYILSSNSQITAQKVDPALLKHDLLDLNKVKTPEPYENPEVLKHLAPIRFQGDNLAFTKASPKINPRQTSYAKQMAKTMYEPVKDKVFLMSGWQLTSTLIVVGNGGLIVIDPGENDEASTELLRVFREQTNNKMPVKGIVYSHRHSDHSFGSAGLGVTQKQVDNGEVRIFAHHQFMEYLINDASIVGDILSARTAFGGALFLGTNEDGFVHGGLGPAFTSGQISFYKPTDVVKDQLQVTVAGVKMIIFEAYGDAEDEIDVYFPDLKHVHGSETVQGETFPNLYTLRGTKYRDLILWYKGVDRLGNFAKNCNSYSGSHMRSWVGNQFINERIHNYRDAIQYVHDQTIKHMNEGATREELVTLVKLPANLANDPWLQEFYGTVAHVVRNVYGGYMGWFQGDATELATPDYQRKAKLYVSAMGGEENVLKLARQAIDAQDYGWAMEVATQLVRSNPEDKSACDIKAEAMRKWGYEQANPYYRFFALSGAGELDGSMNKKGAWNYANPVIVSQFETGTILENLRVNVNPQKAGNQDIAIGFKVKDENKNYGLQIRNGVAVYTKNLPDNPAVTLQMNRQNILDFILGKQDFNQMLTNSNVTISGNKAALNDFINCFDFDKKQFNLIKR
ncbi:MAG: alkyl sulfatase dimerization domain-containing protein [Niabella sp.]